MMFCLVGGYGLNTVIFVYVFVLCRFSTGNTQASSQGES